MKTPDIEGKFGRAWIAGGKRTVDHSASLGSWLLNIPGAHLLWEYWIVGVVHLRAIPGGRPAKKHYPEAEYEFIIASINPEACPKPDPESTIGYPCLTPVDVVYQFHGVNDRDALRIGELAIKAMVDGRISPDQDFRSAWDRVLDATVAHFRSGKHVEH